MHTQNWNVRITIDEDDDLTRAHVVLTSRDGVTVRATGDAHRRPSDAVVPEIGEELAAARALYALADQLMDAAAIDVDNLSHPV